MLKKLQYLICSRRGHGNIEKSGDMETRKRGDIETWRHGLWRHGHGGTDIDIRRLVSLLNLIPSPTEVLKYGSKTISAEFSTDRIPWTPYNRRENYRKRKNDKRSGFSKDFFILKLIFEFSRCLIFKYGFFYLQIIFQIRRFYAFLSTNIPKKENKIFSLLPGYVKKLPHDQDHEIFNQYQNVF